MAARNIKNFGQYRLGERLRKLPDLVLKQIREQMKQVDPARPYRMTRILDANTHDLTPLEAEVLTNIIGCKVTDLYDPEVDLLFYYLRHTGDLSRYMATAAQATLQKVT